MSTTFAEMHYRLRTEGDSPGRVAGAVALGSFIGVWPVYGLHLPLCVVAARALGVSRITTYLAAHVNNPFTAPLWIYLCYGVGRWLATGVWPRMERATLEAMTFWTVGRDIALGSFVVGGVAAAVFGSVAWGVALRWRDPTALRRLWLAVSRRYLPSGVLHWEFVLGKLVRDPVYRALLRDGLLPREGRLLDLGCGRGIVAALLAEAAAARADGSWPADWPEPPMGLQVTGVELRPRVAAVARRALRGIATVKNGSLADYLPEPADGILLLDVLHYLDAETQNRVLARAVDALKPGGVLVLREVDAAAGMRYWLTRVAERLATILRGRPRQRFAYRSIEAWRALLESAGLTVTATPMSEGTPFGNTLLVARRR